MIDETMRPMSHRESIQDYRNYTNKRKSQIALEKKEEFEESLRQSATREVKSGCPKGMLVLLFIINSDKSNQMLRIIKFLF